MNERRLADLSDASKPGLAADPDRESGEIEGAAVKGTMLWFDEAKDYGFILTDEGERLYVDREGFVDGNAPVGRCARLAVELSIGDLDGERVAVDVSLVAEEPTRRARRRSGGFRSSWS